MYPAVTWVDALLGRFALNALTGITITFLVLLGILLLSDTHVILELQPILLSHLMLMVFSMGIGVLNCALFGLPVWEMVWGITMRPLMLASG
ncbi:hypothetical protein ACFSHQ_27975 [Gemmobacter lanyuensis]